MVTAEALYQFFSVLPPAEQQRFRTMVKQQDQPIKKNNPHKEQVDSMRLHIRSKPKVDPYNTK